MSKLIRNLSALLEAAKKTVFVNSDKSDQTGTDPVLLAIGDSTGRFSMVKHWWRDKITGERATKNSSRDNLERVIEERNTLIFNITKDDPIAALIELMDAPKLATLKARTLRYGQTVALMAGEGILKYIYRTLERNKAGDLNTAASVKELTLTIDDIQAFNGKSVSTDTFNLEATYDTFLASHGRPVEVAEIGL